jgi:hypothetical protein
MKYFALAGAGAFILLIVVTTIQMFFNHYRGRYLANQMINQGASLESESPRPKNLDFTKGFLLRMHQEKQVIGANCECDHCAN